MKKLIEDWIGDLPNGRKATLADYDILLNIINTQTEVNVETINELVVLVESNIRQEPTPIHKLIQDETEFESFIMQTYAEEGQQILGLKSLYRMIMLDPRCTELLDLILSTSKTKLHTGAYPIVGIDSVLYDVITETVKVVNGESSELWFAIIYGGKVKGAVGEPIESDVVIGQDNVSLKNYNKITFDFGAMDAETTKQLNTFLNISKLLTGLHIDKSRPVTQINQILEVLESSKLQTDIDVLKEMSKTTDIALIKNVVQTLNELVPDNTDQSKLTTAFCESIDRLLEKKVMTVNWWGLIIKKNKMLFLESSTDIFDAIRSTNGRLSPAIANFHQNHLWVKGSELKTKVTAKLLGKRKINV